MVILGLTVDRSEANDLNSLEGLIFTPTLWNAAWETCRSI